MIVANSELDVRLLTFTNLYPNAAQPAHGLFVERRLLRLVSGKGIEAVVVAPVPRVPGASSAYRHIPRVEQRDGLEVHHPRFISIAGLGRFIAPFTMLLTSLRLVRRLRKDDRFNVIDAHYFYPDGVAAAFLARIVGCRLVITARGTDVNVLPEYLFSRVLIRWAARVADRVITVSDALRHRLIALGVAKDKIVTLRNGVDTSVFVTRDRGAARARTRLSDRLVLLSVGNLIESKGHHLVIEALRELPLAQLVIAGDGPYRRALQSIADRLSVSDRVRFVGVVDQNELIDYYSAADVLVLATLREGMPNVVLEAVSCGLPVVATDCGGIAEVIDRPELGVLMKERSAAAVVSGIRELLARYPSRIATRAAAEHLGWTCTIEKQSALYRAVVRDAR